MTAAGLAECERGDLLRQRGEYVAAEAAYQRASEHGYDAQPGLVLLWLARGATNASVAAVRRMVAEADDPVAECRLLPASVDVLLAAGAVDDARAVAARLGVVAERVGTQVMRATAAFATGSTALASGDAAGALPPLRQAAQLWARAQNPYEVARVRLVSGRALLALGDRGSARRDLENALATFRRLGATPAAEEVERLLGGDPHPGGLTGREVEVLRLVASGCSNAEIAAALVLSEKTVARHLSNVFVKLQVGSRTAAAAYAFEHRLT